MRPLLSILLVALLGCDSCHQEQASGAEAASSNRSGTVANAERRDERTPDGYRVISAPSRERTSLQREAAAREAERERLTLEPTTPDPHAGSFTLDEAVEGLGTDGDLIAEINTTFGTLLCELDARRAPNTVANFVGLARGKRQWWDARAAQWRQNVPFYRGRQIYRVIPDGWIQAGDQLDDGTVGPGYTIPDEANGIGHDRAAQLCMASSGPNENGSTFLVTDGPRPELDADGRYTVFGRCDGSEDLVRRMARVPQGEDNRPLTAIRVTNVRVRRVRGGLENARPTPPTMPDGVADGPRGASPGPGGETEGDNALDPEMQERLERLRRELENRQRSMPGQGIHQDEHEGAH